ncbi:MAG TPA: DoxX family protein [Rhodocyclaceae bacterium]|nr:DoxX family protein [Rhodocyclaceae bacterium]
MKNYIHLIGRILLAIIFILSGALKIKDQSGTISYMAIGGVPAILLWPTIAVELLGGLALAFGFQTRLAAFALAIFTIAAAVLFHTNFADPGQIANFLKNFSMAGGLLLLVASGSTGLSVDTRK